MIKVTAIASLGIGADVGVASTNGGFAPVAAASGVDVWAVGELADLAFEETVRQECAEGLTQAQHAQALQRAMYESLIGDYDALDGRQRGMLNGSALDAAPAPATDPSDAQILGFGLGALGQPLTPGADYESGAAICAKV